MALVHCLRFLNLLFVPFKLDSKLLFFVSFGIVFFFIFEENDTRIQCLVVKSRLRTKPQARRKR